MALVYVAANLLLADLERSDLCKTGLQPIIWALDDYGTFVCIDPAVSLHGHFSEKEAADWASQLVPKAAATVPSPCYDGWRDIPSFCLCCEL